MHARLFGFNAQDELQYRGRLDASRMSPSYLDRYFIKLTVVIEEALHFHELIHVIQWRLLGPEGFLRAYANGLDEFGYENSPLEKMAYDAEASFKRSSAIFDAEKFVVERLSGL